MELWFSENHTPDVKLSLRVDRQLYSKKVFIRRLMCLRLRSLEKFLCLTEISC